MTKYEAEIKDSLDLRLRDGLEAEVLIDSEEMRGVQCVKVVIPVPGLGKRLGIAVAVSDFIAPTVTVPRILGHIKDEYPEILKENN